MQPKGSVVAQCLPRTHLSSNWLKYYGPVVEEMPKDVDGEGKTPPKPQSTVPLSPQAS